MPTYVYECGACKRQTEFFQSMSDAPKRKCPKCGKSKLVRRIGIGAGILFKGSGFYQTDYRSDSYRKGEAAEKPSSSSADKPDAPKTDGKSKGDGQSGAEPKSSEAVKSKPDGEASASKSTADRAPTPKAKKSSSKRK